MLGKSASSSGASLRASSPSRLGLVVPLPEATILLPLRDGRLRPVEVLPSQQTYAGAIARGQRQGGGPASCASEPQLQTTGLRRSASPLVERSCTDPQGGGGGLSSLGLGLGLGGSPLQEARGPLLTRHLRDVPPSPSCSSSSFTMPEEILRLQEQNDCLAQQVHALEQAKCFAAIQSEQTKRRMQNRAEQVRLEASQAKQRAKDVAVQSAATSIVDVIAPDPRPAPHPYPQVPGLPEERCVSKDECSCSRNGGTESLQSLPASPLLPSQSLPPPPSPPLAATLPSAPVAPPLPPANTAPQSESWYVDALGNPLGPIKPWVLPNIKDDPPPLQRPMLSDPDRYVLRGSALGSTCRVEVKDVSSMPSPSQGVMAPYVPPASAQKRAPSEPPACQREDSFPEPSKPPPEPKKRHSETAGIPGDLQKPKLSARAASEAKPVESSSPSKLPRPSSVRRNSREKASSKASASGSKTPPAEPPKASQLINAAMRSESQPRSEQLMAELEDCMDTIKWSADVLKKDGLQELKAMSKPASAVLLVLEAAALLIGQPMVGWERLKKLIGSAAFVEKVCKLNLQNITREQFSKLRSYLDRETFDEELIKQVCVPAVPLATWCRAVGYYLSHTRFKGGPAIRPVAAAQGPAIPILEVPAYTDLVIEPDVSHFGEEQLQQVQDLTISRPGVGSIHFHGLSDILGLDLGRVIRLEVGEVRVYPDPAEKPPIGAGLNRPATVTMYQCWPPQGPQALQNPADEEKYKMKIKQMTEEKQAKFLDYNCSTGVWKFSVQHF